jgi:hypothetical protein
MKFHGKRLGIIEGEFYERILNNIIRLGSTAVCMETYFKFIGKGL